MQRPAITWGRRRQWNVKDEVHRRFMCCARAAAQHFDVLGHMSQQGEQAVQKQFKVFKQFSDSDCQLLRLTSSSKLSINVTNLATTNSVCHVTHATVPPLPTQGHHIIMREMQRDMNCPPHPPPAAAAASAPRRLRTKMYQRRLCSSNIFPFH